MAARATFPTTGESTSSHAQAAAKTSRHATALKAKHDAVDAAGKTNPQRDASRENAERAKREGWSDGTVPGQGTPGQ